jgi:hypothetical protein
MALSKLGERCRFLCGLPRGEREDWARMSPTSGLSNVVPSGSQSAEADEDVNTQHHDGELKGQELGWRGAWNDARSCRKMFPSSKGSTAHFLTLESLVCPVLSLSSLHFTSSNIYPT